MREKDQSVVNRVLEGVHSSGIAETDHRIRSCLRSAINVEAYSGGSVIVDAGAKPKMMVWRADEIARAPISRVVVRLVDTQVSTQPELVIGAGVRHCTATARQDQQQNRTAVNSQRWD